MNEPKLDKRTKWSYCIGATGRDMAYTLVSMYLMTYIQYTMKLTVAQYSTISVIIVLCLIWDAVNDPMMGIIIENSHLKMGKFRPWILIGMLLNVVIIVVLFTVRPQGWGFVAFFGLSYLSWGMTYTMNDISYWGMLPSLSSNPKERNSLVTIMSIFISIGQFSVAGLVPVIVAGNAVVAYRNVAIVVALCFLGFQLLTFFGVKERPRKDSEEKLSLKDMFKIFLRNDQIVCSGIAYVLFNICNGLLILLGVNFFYFEYGYAEGGKLVFIFTIMVGLGAFLSQAAFAVVSSRFKRKSLIKVLTCMIIFGYLMLLMFGYVLPKNIILINAIGFLLFFSQGLYSLVMIVMINNTVEYDEYKFNERHDSIISAARSFAVKLASAANQGIAALILIVSGIYSVSQKISALEIEAGKGAITSGDVLSKAGEYISNVAPSQTLMLRIGMVIFPIATIILSCLIIQKKYKIDEDEYLRMVNEIEARKSKV